MEVFNNRELASVTLVILFFIWACFKSKEVISAFKLVLHSFLQKAIIITLVSLVVYLSIFIFALHSIDVWSVGQLKNTILWFIFVGFVQLLNTNKIKDPNLYLQQSLNDQVKIIVLVEFLVAFHSYSFTMELLLVSVITTLACCTAYAQGKPEYISASKFCNYSLAIIGTLILADTLITIYQQPSTFFAVDTFRDFLVPMLLSVAFLPYMYAFYYFLAYERAFAITRIYTDSKALQRYAKIRSFVEFKGKHQMILEWLRYSCKSEFESKQTIQRSIEKFKIERQLSTL